MKNINKSLSAIRNILHINIATNNDKLNYTKSIPLAIKSNYDIYHVKIENTNTVILSCKEDIKSIKKHLTLFRESLSIPVILEINNINSTTKKYLIENGISFISEDSIYLPQLLIYLNNFKENYKIKRNKKLSKLAQTILISLIVNKQNKIDINSSAKVFNVTNMSTSRALKELDEFDYLDVETIGRKKEYLLKSIIDIEKLFNELKTPVSAVVYIKDEDLKYFENKVEASYCALSKYTNITNNKSIYAVQKEYFDKIIKEDNSITIYDKEYDNNLIQIELWRYSTIINNTNTVDYISLYLSLKDNINIDDSRLADAMNELYNKIKGMIN